MIEEYQQPETIAHLNLSNDMERECSPDQNEKYKFIDRAVSDLGVEISESDRGEISKKIDSQMELCKKAKSDFVFSLESITNGAVETFIKERLRDELYDMHLDICSTTRMAFPRFRGEFAAYVKKVGLARALKHEIESGSGEHTAVERFMVCKNRGLKAGIVTNRGVISSIGTQGLVYCKGTIGGFNPQLLEIESK